MSAPPRVPIAWLTALLLCATPLPAAEPATRLAGVESLAGLKHYHHVEGFRIGGRYDLDDPDAFALGGAGGTTLESLGAGPLRVSWIAVGTPRRNAAGEIVNAVIVSPYYSGDASLTYAFWHEGHALNAFAGGPVVGPGRLIDTDRFYVVFLDALGLWGASKPSDGLGLRFPQYSAYDYVQANYRLLRDRLGIGRVQLATGVSMGAMQSYVWAVMYPDFVEAILPAGGLTELHNVPRWLFDLMDAALKSDPVWRETGGEYYHLPKSEHPNQGMMFAWSLLAHSGMSFAYRNEQPWAQVEKEVFYWEPRGEQGAKLAVRARDFDVIDLLKRNRWWTEDFRLHTELGRVRAKTLILHIANDQWLLGETAERSAAAIEGARLLSQPHPLAHYGVFRLPNLFAEEVAAFIGTLDPLPDAVPALSVSAPTPP